MNPQQAYALARTHQQELRRRADSARFAAELPTSRRRPLLREIRPRTEFGRRVAAARARLAHA